MWFLGFLVAWFVNSAIVAVVAGFQSGEMSLGQWIVAGGGGLVLGYLEVKVLELPFRKQDQVLRAGPGPSPSSGRFIFDKYGARYEVTDTAIEFTVWRPFGRSNKSVIPLFEVGEIVVKWTGLVSVVTKDGQVSRAGLGDRAYEAAQAIQVGAARAGSSVSIVDQPDPRL